MKQFKQYLSEDIIPLAQFQPDAVGIDNGPARDNINIHLANATAAPFQTPYSALEVVRRILSAFHISLPSVTFLDGEEGHEVFTINQFGSKVGMTNNGNFVTAPESPYHVYFEWSATDYGKYDIYCEIVDSNELDDILSDIESEDEEEEMDEEIINEVSQKKATDAYAAADDPDYYHPKADKILGHIKRKFGSKAASGAEDHAYASHFGRGTPHPGKDSLAGGLRQYASDKVTKSGKIPKNTQTAMKNRMDRSKWQGHGRKVGGPKGHLPEEAINELSKGTLGSYITKASHDVATKSAAVGRYAERSRNDQSKSDYMSAKKHDDVSNKMFKKSWKRRQGIAKATDKLTREEAINEVSKSLLQRYKKKADAQSEPLSKKYRKGTISDKEEKTLGKRGMGSSLAMQKLSGYGKPKVLAKEENLDEVSKQLAHKASEKAYEKGLSYYDSTTKLRGKAIKSKDKDDLDKAHAEQGKMSKKWKQSMKFKAYADKKLEEDKKVVTATKKSEKGTKWKLVSRHPDSEGSEMELRQGKRKKMTGYYDRNASMFTMSKTKKGKFDPKSKQKDYDHAKDIMKTVKEDAPFDNPTEKPSTPYKNPAAKAKQLARAAMKKALEKKK